MKILLVRPHAYLPTSQWLQTMLLLEPYAQELIAGAVKPPHAVRICDLAVQKQPLNTYKQVLKEYRPDFIGFGGFSGQYQINRELAGIAKEILPQVLTCLGGIHASSYPTNCKAPELFDLIVRGDGVSAIKVILKSIENGHPVPESEWILPTSSQNFDHLASQTPPPIHPDGINTRPRRDLIDISNYYCICYGEPKQKMITLFPRIACVRTSVGCPNRCSFCVVHFLANGKYLQRSIEDVVDEIASLPQEYIYFVDDETFINAKRMRQLAEMLIERGVKKKYLSWARSDTICRHPDLFALWKKAGLEFVYIGFESLEENNLTGYNKNATPDQNRKARQILRDLNLNIHAALMVNPDFDKKDFEILHKTIEELAPAEYAFTVLSPPPGTKAFEDAKDTFICEDPCLYYDCLHTILPTKLPLKTFYRYFSILYGKGAARIPPRINKVRVPIKDFAKLVWQGIKFARQLHGMYRDYDRKYW